MAEPGYSRATRRHGRRRQFLIGEALTIDAEVLADPFDIVARLVERNALDPVDEIDRSVTRIAVRGDPLRDPTWTGVVCGEGEFARAALVFDQLTEQRRAELGVEGGIDDEAGVVELDAGAPRE